ncbi:iron complex outermembrane recepter protein [Cyclobacterium lianum]|uniref:Iron complex outermembrane recepter protein n=1 Tax=Cyclobacterium lianum TaxID=388280 RepID=A0A1M7I7M3_9BACT|nr:TonB-dependent receptor [Cyclobacterium lianum]SHM36533.1 iron complex outermembrane recepter protein [Cyclobacterium lianum]
MLRFLLLIWLLPVSVFAQTTLRVVDEQSGEPVPYASLKGNNQQAYVADENGVITLTIAVQTEMQLSHVAFQSRQVTVPDSGELTISMQRAETSLTEVVVSSFDSERPLLEQAAGIARVAESELYRFNETSLVHAFNTKPGIRVEERAPASYRISIRGSSLRAPFGVRNVKVYWNGIPFTAADGTTPLNMLDLSNIQNTEIIKGPAGSIYGAGNGGVISFKSDLRVTENRIGTDFSLGDFGLMRYRIGVDQQMEEGGIKVSYAKQRSDGYREHTAMDREVLQVTGYFKPSDKQRLTTQLLYSDLFYELPGALTAAQREEDPRQARPGSAAQNASIDQQSMYGVLSHDYQINPNFSNKTSIYINTVDFENPFNLDYKKETQYSYGGRSSFTYDGAWGPIPVRLIGGGEYQFSKTAAQNFGNRGGMADTVRFSDELLTTTAFLFQQIEAELSDRFLMTLGLSENFSSFDIARNIDAINGMPSTAKRTFDPVIIPRIALSAKLNPTAALHASISSGFSPPTIDEVRTNEGTINLDLEAEKGINYELGYRGSFNQGRVNVDGSVFYFQLDETITTYTNEQGVVLFRNAGATDQKGIEFLVDYALIRNQLAFVQELKLTHTFAGHYFTFADFMQGENDYSGNDLTGVAPHTVVNQLDIRTRPGFYVNFTHQFVDDIPLNDANTVYQEAYHLVNARTGWRGTAGNKLDLEVFAGVENMLNASYSLGNDLNPFGGRYFQPAATRNFYGGIKVGLKY